MISKKTIQNIKEGNWIRELFEKGIELKKQGKTIIDLSLGNPVLEPPKQVIETIRKKVGEKKIHRYMSNAGFESTRKKIAEYLNNEKILKTTWEKIVLTSGAGAGLNIVLKTILNPLDQVIVFTPCFMEYKFYIENYSGKPVFCETKKNYSIDFEKLDEKINKKTKAIIINSPNNPTGKIYSKKELKKLSDLLREKEKKFGEKIFVISDEPYRDIVFNNKKITSITSLYNDSFLVYSWSKSLGLAGERIGFIACPIETSNEIINGLILNNRILGFINAPALMQKTIQENLGLNNSFTKIYEDKKNFLVKELKKIGYELFEPEGAFYLFVKTPVNDEEFCLKALEQGLLITPGKGFKKKNFFRIAFCVEDKTLKKAIPILKKLFYTNNQTR